MAKRASKTAAPATEDPAEDQPVEADVHDFEVAGCACSDDPCTCPPMEVPTCAHCGKVESEHVGSGVLTVTDYRTGPDGELESADIEVERPAKPKQAEAEFDGIEEELHDGRRVTEHEVGMSGKAPILFSNTHAREWFEGLHMGQRGKLIVWYEVGQDGYRPVTDDGAVVGVARFRKLKLAGIDWRPNATDLEGLPLFEQGGSDSSTSIEGPESDAETDPEIVHTPAPDDECFCGDHYSHHIKVTDGEGGETRACFVAGCSCENFDPLSREVVVEEPSPLAESLGIALDAGKCGRMHRGHHSPCPFPANECELDEAPA